MNGIINVYKEKGYTSHDVVARLRGIFHQKKIGHTGTLDPDAQGVLPVCLGNATKVCDLITDKDKSYRAVLLLGTVTDTQDISGEVLSTRPVNCTEDEVISAVHSFVGEYDQIPPMYSAIKIGGKRLYELARAGVEVERPPRRITIHGIDMVNVSLPEVTIDVKCSKGTYIRTLCHDIGERLGCGGTMKSLLRTSSGIFDLSSALKLSEIEELVAAGDIESRIISVDSLFEDLPKFTVSERFFKLLRNGNRMELHTVRGEGRPVPGEKVRIYDHTGTFTGIYEYMARDKDFKPVKLFL